MELGDVFGIYKRDESGRYLSSEDLPHDSGGPNNSSPISNASTPSNRTFFSSRSSKFSLIDGQPSTWSSSTGANTFDIAVFKWTYGRLGNLRYLDATRGLRRSGRRIGYPPPHNFPAGPHPDRESLLLTP